MSVVDVKSAIRANKSGWFESKRSPRGWIIGPVLCLWMSAFDRHGPMVIAGIRSDGFGSRIVGRAGADLDGMLLFILLTPMMAWITWQMHMHGQGTVRAYLIIGLLWGVGLPLTLWINSKDRRDADPLVSFLRRVAQHGGSAARGHQNLSDERHPIKVEVAGRSWASKISETELFDALARMANGDFIVLAKGDEQYIQVASTASHFVVEKREGDASKHFRAELSKGDSDGSVQYDESLRRAFDVLSPFMKGQQPVRDLSWKRLAI